MVSKKLIGIIASVTACINVMMLISNFSYAAEEKYKISEKALAPEYKIEEKFVCPQCKEVRVSPEKGRTLAKMPMICPDCKNEIKEFAIHHCDKCGKDVLVCILCKEAAAQAETMKAQCPECKEVRVRPIKGKTLAKWEMKCPDCKKTSQEWLVLHCDKCGKDFLACPICKKEQEEAREKATK